MGLDMYLFGKLYMFNTDPLVAKIKDLIDLPFQPKQVEFEVGYWRKANAIHKWFVDNIQEGKDDCGYYYVDTDDLVKLKDVCCKILGNNDLAKDLLPVQSGFFFGSTEYDEWYFKDLQDTVDVIEKAMAFDQKLDFYYHSSW